MKVKKLNLEQHVRHCIYTQSSKRFIQKLSRGIIKTRFTVTYCIIQEILKD